MGCNCGQSVPQTYSVNQSVPQQINGTNQQLIKQIEEQNRQQKQIQQVIQQSANPAYTLTKTYR